MAFIECFPYKYSDGLITDFPKSQSKLMYIFLYVVIYIINGLIFGFIGLLSAVRQEPENGFPM